MNSPVILRGLLSISIVFAAFAFASVCSAQPANSSAVNVRLVTDEAVAVLAILTKRKTNQPLTEQDWQRVFQSEGYTRLKKRETSMKRSFDDADFKTFVLSDKVVEQQQALEQTLERWKQADISGAAGLALAYLPKQARISAKIYPVIKPRTNSFVFEVKSDPAIFLYLDPAVSKEKFENTLAHELHHIGYGSACPSKRTAEKLSRLPENLQTVITLIGAFGEGFAMLAAAGGPEIHPHAVSDQGERARWDKDMANFGDDLEKVEKFFLDVLANRLTEEQTREIVSSFFGVQGPWYTVGWKMATTIENTYGRRKLIECMCDQRKLLRTYNKAAARYNRHTREHLATWSHTLIKSIERGS
ncbi:MAG TPA: DUF5700 domain-containing putative Zn-dependent protease [Pyrinomonadaceae bacterium]|nr:DUF5700 domain-containing putative Zn-dependent protease [Pyrinomonadaceae bacterium]